VVRVFMRLVNVDEVRCGGIELGKFLEVCSDVLRKGFISKTVVVDPKTNTAVGNVELCATLKELGVKYIPVSYEFTEDVSLPLEELGFFDELRPSTYRVFRSSEELLYRN
jgi:cysteine synthase/O-phosphoserine sulfhydrylase/cystathionine beta-synthase